MLTKRALHCMCCLHASAGQNRRLEWRAGQPALLGPYQATLQHTFLCIGCSLACVAGKKDAWNGVLGGLAAGGVIGLRVGRVPVGIGAAVALAATSAAVDVSGGSLVGKGMFDDGATPPHAIYPYKQ